MIVASQSRQIFWHYYYYTAGAAHTASAGLVVLLAAALLLGFRSALTIRSHQGLAILCAASGAIVCYAYAMEFFMAYYSTNPYEQQTFESRMVDNPLFWFYCGLLAMNFVSLLLLFPRMRRPLPSLLICLGSLAEFAYGILEGFLSRLGL
jgi:hypothetical protein